MQQKIIKKLSLCKSPLLNALSVDQHPYQPRSRDLVLEKPQLVWQLLAQLERLQAESMRTKYTMFAKIAATNGSRVNDRVGESAIRGTLFLLFSFSEGSDER